VTGQERAEQNGFPDPRQPERYLTPDEERRELVELVPRLPDRLYWFCHPRAEQAYPTVLVRSPYLDMPDMQRRAESLAPDLRSLITRGVVALSPEPEAAESKTMADRSPEQSRARAPEPAHTDVDAEGEVETEDTVSARPANRKLSLG
jgi:hypothetical protein